MKFQKLSCEMAGVRSIKPSRNRDRSEHPQTSHFWTSSRRVVLRFDYMVLSKSSGLWHWSTLKAQTLEFQTRRSLRQMAILCRSDRFTSSDQAIPYVALATPGFGVIVFSPPSRAEDPGGYGLSLPLHSCLKHVIKRGLSVKELRHLELISCTTMKFCVTCPKTRSTSSAGHSQKNTVLIVLNKWYKTLFKFRTPDIQQYEISCLGSTLANRQQPPSKTYKSRRSWDLYLLNGS